jgi:hemin uptake protein HemP
MHTVPSMPPVPARAATTGEPPPVPAEPVRIASERLFAGGREVLIEHAGGLYRLKKTALGKLILTK